MKFDVYNLFNNHKLIWWNTTVRPDPAIARWTASATAPAIITGASFGQGTANRNYPPGIPGGTGGRTFRVAVGIRF